MFANSRISLGVAFLKKQVSATSSAKCIIHAEYIISTKQYLLTKVTFTHSRSVPLNVKTSETLCENIADVLKKLSSRVNAKVEEGYVFDAEGMEIMNEVDEAWGDFEMADDMTSSAVVGKRGSEMTMPATLNLTVKRKKSADAIPTRTAVKPRGSSLKSVVGKQLQRH